MSERLLVRVVVAIVGGALLPIAANAASSHLPAVIERNSGLSWIVLPFLVAVTLVAEAKSGRKPASKADSEPDAAIAFSDGVIPLRSPEFPANQAARYYNNQRFPEAFRSYVKAVDRLHDFYVVDSMRNRQPSAKDAWIIEGLTGALGAALAMDPGADVRNGVVEARARLWDIVAATTRAGLSLGSSLRVVQGVGRKRRSAF